MRAKRLDQKITRTGQSCPCFTVAVVARATRPRAGQKATLECPRRTRRGPLAANSSREWSRSGPGFLRASVTPQDRLSRPRQRPPRRSGPSARARLDGSRKCHRHMLIVVGLVLSNTYELLIILDQVRRMRRKPTVLCGIAPSNERLDRACYNSVTVLRCGRVARGICPLKESYFAYFYFRLLSLTSLAARELWVLAPAWRAVLSPSPALLDEGARRRGGRAAEGARLESVYAGNRIAGSNPAPPPVNCFATCTFATCTNVHQAAK